MTNIIVQWLPHNFQMLRHTFFKFIPVNWTETIVQTQIYLLHYGNSVLFPRGSWSKALASILLDLSRNSIIPGGCGQSNEQGLKDPSDKDNGILLGDEEVHHWQDEESVHHQAAHHRNGIETQLLPNG